MPCAADASGERRKSDVSTISSHSENGGEGGGGAIHAGRQAAAARAEAAWTHCFMDLNSAFGSFPSDSGGLRTPQALGCDETRPSHPLWGGGARSASDKSRLTPFPSTACIGGGRGAFRLGYRARRQLAHAQVWLRPFFHPAEFSLRACFRAAPAVSALTIDWSATTNTSRNLCGADTLGACRRRAAYTPPFRVRVVGCEEGSVGLLDIYAHSPEGYASKTHSCVIASLISVIYTSVL